MKSWLWACLLLVGCQSQTPTPEWNPGRAQVAVGTVGSRSMTESNDQSLQVGAAPPPRPKPTPLPARPLEIGPAPTPNAPTTRWGYPGGRTGAPPVARGVVPPPSPPPAAAVARSQPEPSADSDLLQVTAETSLDGLSGRNSNQIIYLLLEVTPKGRAPVNSGGTNLALVIDVSGSMLGSGLQMATAAAAKIFAQAGALDQAWLIAFANQAKVLISGSERPDVARIEGLLQGAGVGGGTVISSGAQLAFDSLMAAPSGKASHMVLVTDGFASDEGRTREVCAKAWKSGISVSCVGIGHCDSGLLMSIANACNGQFYAVTSAAGLPEALALETKLTRSIVLRDVQVALNLSPGVTLRRAFRPKPLREYPADASPCVVKLGDIHRGDNLQLLLELEVKPAAGRERSLARIEVLSRGPDARARAPQPLQEVKIANSSQHPNLNTYVMKLVDGVYVALQRR